MYMCERVRAWVCTSDQWFLCDPACTATDKRVHTHIHTSICSLQGCGHVHTPNCPASLQCDQTGVVLSGRRPLRKDSCARSQHMQRNFFSQGLHKVHKGLDRVLTAQAIQAQHHSAHRNPEPRATQHYPLDSSTLCCLERKLQDAVS